MTVESVTYISDLDVNNPAGGDSISEGDDHIRNIKKALKGTFPNVTDEVTLTSEEMNNLKQIANGSGSNQLAHAKYSTKEGMTYAVNVKSITETSSGNFVVEFSSPIKNYDYTIAITPAAVNAKPVIAYVTSQALLNPGGDPGNINDYTPNGFVMQIREFNSSGNLVLPGSVGFTFLVVDNDPIGLNNP